MKVSTESGNHLSHAFLAVLMFVFAALGPAAAQTAQAAQENPPARFSMWNRGVFNLYQSNGNTSIGPNWMGYATPQGAFNGLYMAWSAKDVGWTLSAEWDGDWAVFPVTTLAEFSGYYNMFGGALKLTMGKLRADGGYRFANFDTAGFSTRLADGETGIMATVQPIEGVSVGTFLPVRVAERSVATTYSEMNFGASWNIGNKVILKGSYRMEPYSLYGVLKGREIAAGAQLVAVQDLVVTLGYRTYDTVVEHDIMVDAAYGRIGAMRLQGFAYLSIQNSGLYPGFKLQFEKFFEQTPFVAGAFVSFGEGYQAWWLDGWEVNPYLRYEFVGSSVQTGLDFKYKSPYGANDYTWAVQMAYTIGF